MKKFILSPLCAPLLTIAFLVLFSMLAIYQYTAGNVDFFENWHTCDIVTYSIYALAAITLGAFFKDYQTKKERIAYGIFFFLIIAAVLREMGIQHWLTKTDTTAIKLRFFTNPNNPLHEKIISASLVLLVAGVVLYLIWQYAPRIWRGFWNKEPMYWSICTMCTMGIICKIADRFPSNYVKSTGVRLSNDVFFLFTLVEESCEATLPLMALLGFVQFHLMKKEK